jgi:hypothetical protein
MEGRDDERRTAELREGLTRHEDVYATSADARDRGRAARPRRLISQLKIHQSL